MKKLLTLTLCLALVVALISSPSTAFQVSARKKINVFRKPGPVKIWYA